MIEMMYARHALMTAERPEAAAASLWSLSGTLSCAVWPPVLLAAELGFRGWPSASAGPTVMSGASGEGGVREGRPPPSFEPPVSGENIAAGGAGRCNSNGVRFSRCARCLSPLWFATDERVPDGCQVHRHPSVTVRIATRQAGVVWVGVHTVQRVRRYSEHGWGWPEGLSLGRCGV